MQNGLELLLKETLTTNFPRGWKPVQKFYLLTCTAYKPTKPDPTYDIYKNQGVKTLGQPTPWFYHFLWKNIYFFYNIDESNIYEINT